MLKFECKEILIFEIVFKEDFKLESFVFEFGVEIVSVFF